MNRVLAGILEPRDEPAGETRLRLLERALDGAGEVQAGAFGALSVAWTGGDPPATGESACLLDGHVYEVGEEGRRAGLQPGAGAERSLPALLRDEPEPALRSLRGDFAILAWDVLAGRGLIARDQLGGRGLYWCQLDGRLAFASEIRYLLRLLSRRPGPDAISMTHWLAVSAPPEDRTLYEGIRRVEQGALVHMQPGRCQPVRYWLPAYERPARISRSEAVDLARAALAKAIRRRSGSETATGVLLSGGLDSSSVAALAALRLEPERAPVASYSATFPRHPTIDESDLIERLCSRMHLPNVRVVVRHGSVLSGALDYLEDWELPSQSPNLFFWRPLLERAAQDGVRVLLDGEGGDEVFGLSVQLLADRVRRGRVLSALALDRRIPGAGPRPPWRSVARFMLQYGAKGAAPLWLQQTARRLRGAGHYTPPWFRPDAARLWLESDPSASWKRLRGARWWASLVHTLVLGPAAAQTLDHVRRRATSAGVEARHPLIDVDLIELILRLPPELAFDPRHNRPLLRESTAGLLPDELRLRPEKSSFDALFHESLRGADLPAARALLCDPGAELGAYVDLGGVREGLLDRPPSEGGELMRWGSSVWRLVTAECWLRHQGDRSEPRRMLGQAGLSEADYDLVVT